MVPLQGLSMNQAEQGKLWSLNSNFCFPLSWCRIRKLCLRLLPVNYATKQRIWRNKKTVHGYLTEPSKWPSFLMKSYLVYYEEKLLIKISCKLFSYEENSEIQFMLLATLVFRSIHQMAWLNFDELWSWILQYYHIKICDRAADI